MNSIALGPSEPGPSVIDGIRVALDSADVDAVFWRSATGTWIDELGLPVPHSVLSASRLLTPLERDGDWVAGVLHDAELDPALLTDTCMSFVRELDDARRVAELRAQVRDEQASRARIVGASDRQRRRFERNLHDGAQQRLVGLALMLRLAEKQADPAMVQLLDEAVRELDDAIDDLRELARGLHPAIVTDAGFAAAVETLAEHPGLPVALSIDVTERLPEAVAVAAYYLVAETLTNANKHSGASRLAVDAQVVDGWLRVRVTDDGNGGASTTGSGLMGLADRLSALGGQLTVDSEPGRGTTVSAELPLQVVAATGRASVDDILLRVVEPDDLSGPYAPGTARHARWLQGDQDRRRRAFKWMVWQNFAAPGEIIEAQPEYEDLLNGKLLLWILGGNRRLEPARRDWLIGYLTALGFSESTLEAMVSYDDGDDIERLLREPRVAAGRVVNTYEALRASVLATFDSRPADVDAVLRAADRMGISREVVAELHDIVLEEARLRERRHHLIVAPAMPKVLNDSIAAINTNHEP